MILQIFLDTLLIIDNTITS